MAALIKKNLAFFIPYFIFLVLCGIALIFKSKIDIALFINRYHCTTADFLFKYYTLIGLGWLIVPVIIALCFIRLRYLIIAITAFIVAVVITEIIKFAVGAPRPAEVFAKIHRVLYFVSGVPVYHWNSFPSGHSTVSFCLFCMLALISGRNFLKLTFFILAFLVAYSRMYLSEHFLIDVYTGSFIGVTSTLVAYKILINWKGLNKWGGIDKPVIQFKKAVS